MSQAIQKTDAQRQKRDPDSRVPDAPIPLAPSHVSARPASPPVQRREPGSHRSFDPEPHESELHAIVTALFAQHDSEPTVAPDEADPSIRWGSGDEPVARPQLDATAHRRAARRCGVDRIRVRADIPFVDHTVVDRGCAGRNREVGRARCRAL